MIKKIFLKSGDKVISFGEGSSITGLQNLSGCSHRRFVGKGRGYAESLILTGSTDDVTIENCVVVLKEFKGKLIAKNSQIYIESAECTLDIVNSSVDIIGLCTGDIKSLRSYINVDQLTGSYNGTCTATLQSVFIGASSLCRADTSSIICDIAKSRSINVNEDIFNKPKLSMRDIYSLEGLPFAEVSDGTIFKINSRYLYVEITKGKISRVKNSREVFLDLTDGVSLIDSNSNVIYRKQ